MRKLVALGVLVLFILVTTLSTPVFGETKSDNSHGEYAYHELDAPQENETEAQPIHLNLFGGDQGELSPRKPQGNSTEVDCEGSPYARIAGYVIGTWTSCELTADIVVDGVFSCSFWVSSLEGASNVHFSVEIQIDGYDMYSFSTNSVNVGSTPVEITGEGNSGYESIFLFPGNTIGIQLTYFSDPIGYFGQGAASTLIVGGAEYDSHITIQTYSIYTQINEPQINENFVTFSADYKDAFSTNNLMAQISVKGMSNVKTLSGPTFSPGNNWSLVTWTWDYKTDKGIGGKYLITITLSYSEDNKFGSTGQYNLTFSKDSGEDNGELFKEEWFIPVIIIGVVAAVAVAAVVIVLRKRSL